MADASRSMRLGDLVAGTGLFSGSTPVTVDRFEGSNDRPAVSFVIPIYNQARLLRRNLSSIATCSVLPAEYILVLDGCTDGSGEVARAWASEALKAFPTIASITLAECAEEIFETNCDNLGAALATADCLIEVQSDMHIEQTGFDAELQGALGLRADLIAVSARGAHAWSDALGFSGGRLDRIQARVREMIWQKVVQRSLDARVYRPTSLTFLLTKRVGRLNELVDLPLGAGRPALYLGETVMRGPLAIDVAKFRDLGGFDGSRFFLGNDDHDLMARAWVTRRWRCGHLPIAFSSPLSDGATRQEKTPQQKRRFGELKAHYSAQLRTSTLAGMAGASMSRPPCEVLAVPGRRSSGGEPGQR